MPNIIDVNDEASRRFQELLGTSTDYKTLVRQTKGHEKLLVIFGKKLILNQEPTEQDIQYVMGLLQLHEAQEKIRAKSNDLCSMDPIPEDYRENKYWE